MIQAEFHHLPFSKQSKQALMLWTLAISSLSGCTSQPNLNSIVHSLKNAPRSTGDVDALNQLNLLGSCQAVLFSI